jgi:quercetin dioxygenase-like cupin family protein
MRTESEGQEAERLRTPPSERFAGASDALSVSTALRELRAESHPARDGHRQITLSRRGPVSHVLFSFDEGGFLERHAAQGVVTIHVLEGRLKVETEGKQHELADGHILVLDPGVSHDVRAPVAGAMLLTVHLQKE